jgi:serine/threonine protein kinase
VVPSNSCLARQLLHNELIPVLPFVLKAKMAYQTAKGMHFLHSSGIVHRDLKSMNLLLDSKWNVKVSDFGLTKFRAEMKKRSGAQLGSIHWSAPEILNESPDVDYVLTDVYSFGIILWEILTRGIPYYGLR